MNDALKKDLLAKREEVNAKLKQLEADLYYFQGYLKALDDLLETKETPETPEQVTE